MAVEIERKEIYRYLGYRGHEADPETKALVEVCVDELMTAAEPKRTVGSTAETFR